MSNVAAQSMELRLTFAHRFSRRELRSHTAGGDSKERAVLVLVRDVGVDRRTHSGYDYLICV